VAKIGDVGLARFMPNDYMSAQAAIGGAFPGSPAHILRVPTSISRDAMPGVRWNPIGQERQCDRWQGNRRFPVLAGAFVWSAPEVLMGAKCSNKVDIYSFGVILWELVTGESPQRGRMRSIRWGTCSAALRPHARCSGCCRHCWPAGSQFDVHEAGCRRSVPRGLLTW
jgi:serine/threonine protein kinase